MKLIKNYINRFKKSLFLGGSLTSERNWKGLFNDISKLDQKNGANPDIRVKSVENMLKSGLVTEEQLAKAKKMSLFMSKFSLFISIFIIFYLIYATIKCYYIVVFMSFLLLLVTLSLSFRYHFWYMQIVKRRLGCTFNDWLLFTFRPKSKQYKD